MRGLLGLLMAGSATMALAQETVAPPTITPPAVSAPAATPAPAPAASPGITFAPNAAVVQQAPPPAPPPESVRNPVPEPGATASVTRSQPRRAAAPMTRAAPAAVAPTATAAPVNEVASETPAAAPSPEITPPPAAPAAAPEAAAAPAQPEEVSSGAAWAILGLTLAALIGGIAWLIARRRRRAAAEAFDYGEPAYVEETAYVEEPAYQPTYQTVEEPVAAAPVAAAAVATEPGARPWIDIGLRPIRAEADGDLKVELTVSNSGDADAHGVRVSTWMLDGARSSDNEQAMIDARDDAQVATLDVATGDDRAVDTRVPLPSAATTPLLVAEARYPLPDGGEGRIAAAFEIEANGDEVVEARLHEVLERA